MERIFFCGNCQKFFFVDCEPSVYTHTCKHCQSDNTVTCNLPKDVYDNYSDDEKSIFKRQIKGKYPNVGIVMVELDRYIAEEKRINAIKAKEAERLRMLDDLRNKGYEGYYEYKTVCVFDSFDGGVNANKLSEILNENALSGWRLVTAYTNELGHNSTGGYVSVNATMDEHILIMERFVRF